MSGWKHLGPGLSAESLLGVLSAESLLGAESLLCDERLRSLLGRSAGAFCPSFGYGKVLLQLNGL